jgi:hypothetical protein
MTRETLPNARLCVTRDIWWLSRQIQVSMGFFADGRPAEVFVNGLKVGTDVQAVARDASIILSLALQHGAPLDIIKGALTRGEHDEAASLIGVVVDLLEIEVAALAEEAGTLG